MQKNRKLISVLLAMVMMLSVISAGLVAAAQEAKATKDAVVTALEKKINDFEGNAEDNKAGYDAMIADFQKLTGEQKDSIDVLALDKLTHLMYVYEKSVAEGSLSVKAQTAAKKVVETLDSPALNAAQKAVDDGIMKTSGNKIDELVEIYKALPNDLARIMTGTAYSTYGLFYYPVSDGRGNNAFYNVVNRIYTQMKKDKPYSGPSRPSSFDKTKYPGGSKDPAYISDYREYTLKNYSWEIELVKESVKKFAADTGISKYADIITFAEKATAALDDFYATKSLDKAKTAVSYYNTFDLDTQTAVQKLSLRGYVTFADKDETSTSATYCNVSDLFEKVDTIAKYETVAEFEKYIATVKEPYTVKVALEAVEKYQTVPKSLRSELSDQAKQKIDALTYITLTENPSQEKPDISGYKKTNITYPDGITKEQTLEALPKMNAKVNEIVNALAGSNLKTLITDGVYTNAAIAAVQKKIGPMLGTLGIDGNVNPSGLLPYIATKNGDGKWISNYSPKWDGAVAALEKVANDTDNWEDVVYINGDWFIDGDREGFADSFGVILMLSYNLKMIVNVGSMLFNSLQFENKYNFSSATYETGSYENIVHIFEAIGIPCRDSVTYTENFNLQTNDTDRMIARISPIVSDLFAFVEQFAETPVTTLTEILPNVAYALNEGIIDENIHTIIDRIGGLLGIAGVTLPTLDFTAEGIFNTLGGLGIEGITYEETTNSAGQPVEANNGILTVTITLSDGSPATLKINEKDFLEYLDEVEGCGEMVAADSICVNNAYKPNIVSDKADTFVTTVRFIYDDVLLTNKDTLKEIINVANETVGTIIGPVIDVMAKYLPADSVIVALVNVANPQVPDVNIGGGEGEEGGIAGFIKKLIDLIMGIFNPTDDPDNPNNPDNPFIPNTTAGKIIAPIAVIAVLGGIGAGAVACVNKFKKDDEE